ncbi:hypothetical protein BN1058_00342 [Paraliobacillus sp. PM-2]|uniref:DUF4097 family beta strand repeat-containing protein n=1 Tax=Paraliobacillus sp. PM-2 TaxID=1462524 RepID=UPI00061C8C5A|nr:DUF4097 family beta strand repeat-containing protein [Paraliobacillus sp. PM-2]CQR46095.1 hypothetical protein BN1058_00342 [Paraliobacillus sp. PM-2]
MKKIAGIALITGLIGLIGIFIFRNEIFSYDNGEQLMEFTDFDKASINQLDINVDVVDLQIEKSPDQSIHVSLTGHVSRHLKEQMDYQVYQENNKLFIKLDQRNKPWFSFPILPFGDSMQLDLVLQVPDKHFEKLTLDSNVADLSITYGDFSSINITSDIGDIEMKNTKTAQVDVETNIGDITIYDGIGRWDVVSDVGEISLELLEWKKDIMIQSDIGDIEVFIQQMPKAFQMNLASDVGDVHTTGVRQGRTQNENGNLYIEVGTDGPLMDVRSDIGEVEVVSD